jgi:hypothetical protein
MGDFEGSGNSNVDIQVDILTFSATKLNQTTPIQSVSTVRSFQTSLFQNVDSEKAWIGSAGLGIVGRIYFASFASAPTKLPHSAQYAELRACQFPFQTLQWRQRHHVAFYGISFLTQYLGGGGWGGDGCGGRWKRNNWYVACFVWFI